MSYENRSESLHLGYPVLFSFLLTLIYGLVAYLSEFLNLKQTLFGNTLTAFQEIVFKFISRFSLSGMLWLVLLPLVLYLMIGFSFREFFSLLRFNLKQGNKTNLLLSLIIIFTLICCIAISAVFLDVFTLNFSLLISPDYENGLGWFIFIFALIPGIWEEIAFRGIIFSFLLSKYSVKKAVIVDGVLFSIFHIFNYLILQQDLVSVLFQSIAAIFVGISLCYVVIKTNSLLPVILIHYSIDVTLFISGFIFDLNNPTSTLIFAILSLLIIPSLVISSITFLFEKKGMLDTAKLQ
jgi:membrane protease YdiL (CAAX protease family)